MKFSEKFYPDAINCKVKNGEKVFYDIAFKKESNNHILGFLYTGTNVDDYYQLGSEKNIVSSLIDELDKCLMEKPQNFTQTNFYLRIGVNMISHLGHGLRLFWKKSSSKYP